MLPCVDLLSFMKGNEKMDYATGKVNKFGMMGLFMKVYGLNIWLKDMVD